MNIFTLASLSALFFILSLPLYAETTNDAQEERKFFGKDHPFEVTNLPPGQLRDKLESLPNMAREKAMKNLHRFNFPAVEFKHLRVSDEGDLYFVDSLPEGLGAEIPTSSGEMSDSVTLQNAFSLHSKPFSPNVIYLDFNGEVISGTAWNASSGIDPIATIPYDRDNDPENFNDLERDAIVKIWRRVAEDYAPFDVDVTTEEPGTFGPTVGRILITSRFDENGIPFYELAGGVAYVNVWGRSNYAYYSPAFVFYNELSGNPGYISEAASHEMGHNLGLLHDGNSTSAYHPGELFWAPIMGVGYSMPVTQWSIGNYPDANQYQDDIQIITEKFGALRPDDHGDDIALATSLTADSGGIVSSTNPGTDPNNIQPFNKGIIGSRNDVDWFKFHTSGGVLDLHFNPENEDTARNHLTGENLNIQATLYDSEGVSIVVSNPDGTNEFNPNTSAQLSLTLDKGLYFISVEGEGDLELPYIKYGSQSQYFINGTIAVSDRPVAVNDNVVINPLAGQSTKIDVLANDGNPGSDDLYIHSVGLPSFGEAVIDADRKSISYSTEEQEGSGSFEYTVSNLNGMDTATVYFKIQSILSVNIDIKPGSEINTINLASQGVLPVAIFSTSDFTATTLNPETLTLQGMSVKMAGKSKKYLCSEKDINQDGLTDLLCSWLVDGYILEEGETTAVLEGETFSGQKIKGMDTVTIVPM